MMSDSVVIQYLLKMPACAGLVADIVLGHAHVVLAEQPIVQVRPAHCEVMQPLCKRQRSTESTAPGLIEIQASQSTQLVRRTAKPRANLDDLRHAPSPPPTLPYRPTYPLLHTHFPPT